MKVLGISNPNFMGVSIATKAVCTEYLPVDHIERPAQLSGIANTIIALKPDILIIGGWSKGYFDLLKFMKRHRNFPILSVYHSTLFHGAAFNDEVYWKEFEIAYQEKYTDFIGFVQPQTAEYYRVIRGIPALFIPHFFKMQPQRPRVSRFKIGVFGGLENTLKNTSGAVAVAMDFAKNHPNCDVVAPSFCDRKHAEFLEMLGMCSLIIHLSHLECYSNTIQEAWARGIPAITSPANSGLIEKNPLLAGIEKAVLAKLCLRSGIDAMELYEKIESVYGSWVYYSSNVYRAYNSLSERSEEYLNKVFKNIIKGYASKKYNEDFFEYPYGDLK